MPKEIKLAGDRGTPTCSICGHSAPWHSMICPKAAGLNCIECEMLLPRHYPWCSIGKRDGFGGWGISRWDQKDVEEIYNQHMRERIALRAVDGKREVA